MVGALTELAPRPVLYSKVKVQVDEDLDPDERARAEATMDVSGVVLRAEGAAPDPLQAIRVVGNRLERRVNRLAERRQKAEKRPPSTPRGVWKAGDLPTNRPGFYDRPPQERRVVRHKTYSPSDRISISEAVFDLDVLDYRFFLFTDDSGGTASVVYEDDEGVVLRRADGSSPEADIPPSVTVNETPAPRIGLGEAVSRLNLTDMPFIFFVDEVHDEAQVLYRRYDGHYGLIVPV